MKLTAGSTILDQIATPALDGLSPEAARAILRVKLKPADVKKIHSLSALAKKGSITELQRGELDMYLQVGHLLTLMHSKARSSLKTPATKRRKTA